MKGTQAVRTPRRLLHVVAVAALTCADDHVTVSGTAYYERIYSPSLADIAYQGEEAEW
jgi:hypothetical protein